MSIAVGSSTVVDLAQELSSQAAAGGAGRATVAGDRAVAFSWADAGPWAATVFDAVTVEGLTYRSTLVEPSGTAAAKVAKGGTKPGVVTITTATKSLPKYSGMARVFTEDVIDTANLVGAIGTVLFDVILDALSADVAAVFAGAALDATGASWSAAILNAVGVLPRAQLLVLAPADMAAVVSPAGGFTASNSDALMSVFGLVVLPLPGLPAGTAYVCTSSAVTMFDSAKSPLMLLDPYSASTTNEVLVVGDVFAAAELTSPGNAVAVTVAP